MTMCLVILFHLWTQLCSTSSDFLPSPCYGCYYLGTGDVSPGLTICTGTAGGQTGYEERRFCLSALIPELRPWGQRFKSQVLCPAAGHVPSKQCKWLPGMSKWTHRSKGPGQAPDPWHTVCERLAWSWGVVALTECSFFLIVHRALY